MCPHTRLIDDSAAVQQNSSDFDFEIKKDCERTSPGRIPAIGDPLLFHLCAGICHGFGSWFDVYFGEKYPEDQAGLVLSTSPNHPCVACKFLLAYSLACYRATHW